MRDLEIVQFGTTIENNSTYFVRCGCQTFVFLSKEDLNTFISQYIDNPEGYEKAWYTKYSNDSTGGQISEIPTQSRTLGDTLRRRG